MTFGGWIFMILGWGAIIGLLVFCMVRTLGSDKGAQTPPGDKPKP